MTGSRAKRLARLGVFWIALAATLPAAGALPLPDNQTVRYELEEERLGSFLRRFLSDQGFEPRLSQQVENDQRTLSGVRAGSPAEILESILETNGLAAYVAAGQVHIVDRNEVVSRYVQVDPDRLPRFRAAIDDVLGEHDVNEVRASSDGLVRVTGVPVFVDEVAQLAAVLRTRERDVAMTFRFFDLDNAFASDRSFRAGDREVTLPGVATVLQRLVGGGASTIMTSAGGSRATAASRPSLRGEGLSRREGASADLGEAIARIERSEERPREETRRVPAAGGEGPVIVAAPHGNGIIVRDVAERMPLYEDLVGSLDVEPTVIEIQATIININIDRLERLGIEFRGADNDFEAAFSDSETKPSFLDALGADDVALLPQISGFQIGAIIGGGENRLITRINALEEEGAASIVSRPTILTLNGLEASVESSQQIFVPVEGAFEVDLFDVFAGTVMRVTPQVNDAGDRIRLFITIEDGSVELTLPEGSTEGRRVPTVTRNSVTTQGLINEGQSLLLGGLIEERATTNERKVPVLGDIPVVGRLFRSTNESEDRIERLFLIRPRVVDPDAIMAAGGPALPSASADALDQFNGTELEQSPAPEEADSARGSGDVADDAARRAVPSSGRPRAGSRP